MHFTGFTESLMNMLSTMMTSLLVYTAAAA